MTSTDVAVRLMFDFEKDRENKLLKREGHPS